jgi:lactate dehydrogenase-like 2-hydroxyacid dehydrogenase
MKKTLLALQTILPAEMKQLEEHFNVIRLWKENDPEATIKENAENIVAILSTYNCSGVSRKLMEALPNLEIIAQFGVGYNNIDVEAAAERGVAVTYTPDILTNDTADTALALLLAAARRVCEGDMFVRVGRWRDGPLPLGMTLSGKKAGVVGLGRIGRAIAKRLEAFDIEVMYHGRSQKDDVSYSFYADLKEMAQTCDFLVLACAGGPATENLINLEILEALGSRGVLVNIARGTVVNEDDLQIALRNGSIAAAGLDVFRDEPNVPESLLKMDNVVLLPHIGSATIETRSKMGQLVVDNFLAHFEGQPVLTPVAA